MPNTYTVLEVAPHRNRDKPTWRAIKLSGEKGEFEAVCFGTQADSLEKNQSLPDGWTVEQGQYGPILRYPKTSPQGGTGRKFEASWRNTEAGFKFEQRQMNRRTALMQAIASWQVSGQNPITTSNVIKTASDFFEWLEKG